MPFNRTFVGATRMTKMEHGALLPLHCRRSSPPAAPSLTHCATGPGHRGGHAPPRGLGAAPPGRPPCCSTSGPSGARRAEPVAVGRSPRALLRPARDPAPLAPRSGEAALDVLAPAAGPTDTAGGYGLIGPSTRPREPDLGISPHPR